MATNGKLLKGGYGEEYRCFCLALSLAICLPSPNLADSLLTLAPQLDSQLGIVACYAGFLALIYCLGITLDGLIPYQAKDWLLYPSIVGHGIKRPGCKVFSNIEQSKCRDMRFKVEEAQRKYRAQIKRSKSLSSPESTCYQNAEWYKLYRKHAERDSVQSSNMGYLYGRDVFSLSFLVLLLLLCLNALGSLLDPPVQINLISFMLVSFFAATSWITSHLKARRLVYSVIACDVATERKVQRCQSS